MKSKITFSRYTEPAFTDDGFNNWKKPEKFTAHEESAGHKEALLKLAALRSTPVTAKLSHKHAQDQERRRSMFLKQLSSLQFLLRQGLAIRGHTDEESNLSQLLKLRCEDEKTYAHGYKKRNTDHRK